MTRLELASILGILGVLAAGCLIAIGCADRTDTGVQASAVESQPCTDGSDDTVTVQAAMNAGRCLPPGRYNVDAPQLGANGRRRDAMLTGGLCGIRADSTTVRFRGDAHALYWIGINMTSHSAVRDITLDSSCLTNTPEQSHLIHTGVAADGTAVQDTVLIHPHRSDGSSAGDCINIVGSGSAPNVGMAIDHNSFIRCARVGVQISRGLDRGVITDNDFVDCAQDVGSEGGGVITNLTVAHNHAYVTGTPRGYSFALERITGLKVDHNHVDQRPVLAYICDTCSFTGNTMTNLVPGVPAIVVGDTAHHLQVAAGNLITQHANAQVIRIAPLGSNRQADFADVQLDSNILQQMGAGDFVLASGVTGITLSNSRLVYDGPDSPSPRALSATSSTATPPATSVPTTSVLEIDDVHVGFQ